MDASTSSAESTAQETTKKHECYTRGPRELFIFRKAPHHGLSGLVSMSTHSSLKLGYMSGHEEVMIDSMLDTFDPHENGTGYTSGLIPNRTLCPLLYTCGNITWLGGHCTGTLEILPLCVSCAHREGILPKAQLDKIVAQAESERKEAEALVKSGVCANISSAYEYLLNSQRDEHDRYEKIVAHFETQLAYVAKSNNDNELNVPDDNGRLLLHRALYDNDVSSGTIEMIANKNRAAAQVADNHGLLPLHIACMVSVGRPIDYEYWGFDYWEYIMNESDSESEWEFDGQEESGAMGAIRHVLKLDSSLLDRIDDDGCNALHHACRSGILEAVTDLLKQRPLLAYVKNKNNLLPIHLLCDKFGKDKRTVEKVEYIDAIWQLLLTYPDSAPEARDDLA